MGNVNHDIRKYLYKFVPEILNNNPLFVKVFGKNFANKRIKQNVRTVITNELRTINGGAAYQKASSKSITFCSDIKDSDNILTLEQMKNDEQLQLTSIHECIHAILQRTRKECKQYSIDYGTGLLERYYFGEIGRGLNEGYTEWLCEKLGFKATAYPELTNFVRLIEAAIGTEKTMMLGKGGILDNFSEILSMSQRDVKFLLGLSDQLYIVQYNIRTENRLLSLLKNKEMIDLFDEEKKEKIEQYYDKSLDIIEQYKKDPAFDNYCQTKGLEKTEESLIKYLNEESIPNLKKQENETIISFESLILDRFFIKDLQHIFNTDKVSEENLKKLYKINSFLNTRLKDLPDYIKNMKPPMTALVFKEEGMKVVERFIKQSVEKDTREYKSGKLNINDFIQKLKTLFEFNPNLSKRYLKEFAKYITFEGLDGFKQQFFKILETAYKNADNEDFIKSIAGASIYKLKSQDLERNIESILIYDKENYFDRFISKATVFRSVSEDYEFDFTIELNSKNEYKKTMENFLKLQKRVFTKNPNAKIHIAYREIIVQDGDNTEFYEIKDGKLIPMIVEEKMDLQFSYEEKKQTKKEQTSLVPVKNNVLDNIINFIKRKINQHRNKWENDNPNYTNEELGKIVFDVLAKPIGEYKVNPNKFNSESYLSTRETEEREER